MIIEKIAICRKKYDANVKNLIAKKSSNSNQSDYSDKALQDKKAQLSTLDKIVGQRYCNDDKYNVTLTILLEFSLLVATP